MRVIGGDFKGHKLVTVAGDISRPVSGMLKGMIFNVIRPHVEEAKVLDICCGCGTLGVEALSQGASHVTFIEEDRKALIALEKNLLQCRMTDRSTVLPGDAERRLHRWFPGHDIDLVFFDPPYKSNLYDPIMHILGTVPWLADSVVIVAEHLRSHDLPETYGSLHSYRRLVYSTSAVTLYSR